MKFDMSNTEELESLHNSIGDFIYCVLKKENTDPLLVPSREIITAIRNTTLEFIEECLDVTIDRIRENK